MKTYGKMLKPKRAEVKKNVIKNLHPGCRVYNPTFFDNEFKLFDKKNYAF